MKASHIMESAGAPRRLNVQNSAISLQRTDTPHSSSPSAPSSSAAAAVAAASTIREDSSSLQA